MFDKKLIILRFQMLLAILLSHSVKHYKYSSGNNCAEFRYNAVTNSHAVSFKSLP